MFFALYMMVFSSTNDFEFIKNKADTTKFINNCVDRLQKDNPDFMKAVQEAPGNGYRLFSIFEYLTNENQTKEAAFFLFEAAQYGSSEAMEEMEYYIKQKNINWKAIFTEKEKTLTQLYTGLKAAHISKSDVRGDTPISSAEHTPGPDSGSDPEDNKRSTTNE